MTMLPPRVLFPGLFLVAASSALAQDWSNSGGNAQRNGLAAASYGPLAATSAWSTGPSSIIAWQPAVAGGRVFVVRQTGFVPSGTPNESPVFAFDLATGQQLWRRDLPFASGQWTTWVLGHSQGKVYASRSGNGASSSGLVYALDEATGATVWTSVTTIDAGAYDGVVFADNGDLLVASFTRIWRIRASDGTTAWTATRQASVSGNCGAARFGNALYVADAAAGGNVLKRYDVATGAFQYASPVMPGFLSQHTPMVGPDGTVYYNRAQNNPAVDFFYAFTDTGSAFVQRWSRASLPGAGAEYGCGPDGSVYMVQPGEILSRLDPTNGAVLSTYPTALGYTTTRFAIDADGRVFCSNGGFATGRLFAFEPDLTLRWSVPVPNVNIGGPCLAADGTLVVAGVGGDLRAYRTASPWLPVPGGIPGGNGEPVLSGTGSLTVGNPVTVAAVNALPNGVGLLVLGASAINVPVFGGTLVPSLDVTLVALLDPSGAWSLTFPWPAGQPAGTNYWWQLAVIDPAAPFGIAASDGLRSTAQQ
ncbi:MAG TPA: PQQ-binding-like beta-propeller repeat protein [Planctomycetota bacterium]